MSNTSVLRVKSQQEEQTREKGKSTKEKIENTYTDELIFAICSPIGTEKSGIIDIIKKKLIDNYKYEDVIIIKLSSFIERYYTSTMQLQEGKTSSYSKLIYKIEGGNYLRENYESRSILVELAIAQIRADRNITETQDIKGRRVCYIIDSLKNYEELQLLRTIYRDIFYLFSIFSPEQERRKNLRDKGLSDEEINELIETDDFENKSYGQNVKDTFIEGDFFIRSSKSNEENIESNIEKYLHLIFNSKIITPSPQENAMYLAKSAAGNSACLSRQVGAAITSDNNILLAQGWNDVPKYGGNLYNGIEEQQDGRCYKKGCCTNATHKNNIIEDILTRIGEVLQKKEQTDRELNNEIRDIIKDSKFKSIIEYSRSIHAEMHAIIIGSQQTGDKMIGGNLYCTTYPCHNCARHIVLSGIRNIYYIEPYRKSLCLTLHSDALTEDESDMNKVRILLYDGVAPRRYLEFFSMKDDDRKDREGQIINKNLTIIYPKNRLSLQAIPALENQAIHYLSESGLI